MSRELTPLGVDFHCHLDLYPDLDRAVRSAEEARVYTLAVTTTPKAWARNREVTQGTRFVRAALGLHPQLVGERADELALWDRHLHETRYVGEVGLDAGPAHYKSFGEQRRIFQHVLQRCADAGDKILTVHSVRTVATVLTMLERHLPADRGKVVLHWFTGSKNEANRAVALGCYFSVNAPMLQSDRGRALVSALPIDRLLTETDGPFTEVAGRPARPADVEKTLAAVASLRGIAPDDLRTTIFANLKSLLSFRRGPALGEAPEPKLASERED